MVQESYFWIVFSSIFRRLRQSKAAKPQIPAKTKRPDNKEYLEPAIERFHQVTEKTIHI
jgi:hypothetical protein